MLLRESNPQIYENWQADVKARASALIVNCKADADAETIKTRVSEL